MKCDNPGCKNEGHVIQKHGVICYECNDRDIEYMESRQFRQQQNEYAYFIKAAREANQDTHLVLSERDWNKVQDSLNSPRKPNDKLLAAFNKYESENPPKATDTKALFAELKNKKILSLPTDSNERKNYPIFRGCIKYFTAALAGVARISKNGNDKHNPGEEMYHARGKSSDHGDCIIRHLMDTEDLIAAKARGHEVSDQQILDEASQMAWRSLAYCQELHEKIGKAPMASGAK